MIKKNALLADTPSIPAAAHQVQLMALLLCTAVVAAAAAAVAQTAQAWNQPSIQTEYPGLYICDPHCSCCSLGCKAAQHAAAAPAAARKAAQLLLEACTNALQLVT
jgi:hypothetical protein